MTRVVTTLTVDRTAGSPGYPKYKKEEEMESPKTRGIVCSLAVLMLMLVLVSASSDRTKTVEFNVRPGGVVHTFSQEIVSGYI